MHLHVRNTTALFLLVSASTLTVAFPSHGDPIVVAPAKTGLVTDVHVTGFASSRVKGAVEIKGQGKCMLVLQIRDMSKPLPGTQNAYREIFIKTFYPTTLPVTVNDIGPFPDGPYQMKLIGYDTKSCPVQGPDKTVVGAWVIDFKIAGGFIATPAVTGGGAQGAAGGGGAGGGGGFPSPKPANGALTGLSVPGGSFAQDETQKIQVSGTGGCGFDLQITNKSYGGNYDVTVPVLPLKLGPSMLYNGTHFGTLAEGSYKAIATGKNGCTGTGTIDFKVTPKTSTKAVLGKPTITFDQQPKSGGVFSASKDSNIWFKVTVPQSVKDEPYASCCDVEFDFQNEFGGWEPLPSTPFQDSAYSLALKQPAAVVFKSVSYFSQGSVWRVKMRPYKFKTEFEWSDWVELKVSQQ